MPAPFLFNSPERLGYSAAASVVIVTICLLALPPSLTYDFVSAFFLLTYLWLPCDVPEYEKLRFAVATLFIPVRLDCFILSSFLAREAAVELFGPLPDAKLGTPAALAAEVVFDVGSA